MNFADIIVIGLIGLMIFVGRSRGLLLSVFKIASYFLSIFLAFKFAPMLSRVLDNTSIFASMKISVSNFIDNIITSTTGLASATINEQVDRVMQELNFNQKIGINLDIDRIKEQSLSTSSMIESLGDKIAQFLLLAISFIILYILIKIALFFVEEIIKKTGKIPVIKTFDKLGGAIFGAIEGVIIVWVIFTVFFLFRANNSFGWIFEMINNSIVALFLYENNIVLNFISNLI